MRGRFVKGIAAIFRSRGRTRIGRINVAVVAANVASWGWALVAFHDYPVLLGMAMLAYSLGLRHAFDADHIAAIDNVTRKLMQEGSRPVAVGLFFSLGHSTVVVGLSIAIAVTTASLQNQFDLFKNGGGMVAALASALFLFAIAAANIVVLISICRVFRVLRNSGRFLEHDLEHVLASRGFLTRVLGRVFRVINHSWQMYPLGVLPVHGPRLRLGSGQSEPHALLQPDHHRHIRCHRLGSWKFGNTQSDWQSAWPREWPRLLVRDRQPQRQIPDTWLGHRVHFCRRLAHLLHRSSGGAI
jgi:High-affinity nickel-transport protein